MQRENKNVRPGTGRNPRLVRFSKAGLPPREKIRKKNLAGWTGRCYLCHPNGSRPREVLIKTEA
jgi:hypothetical protein